MLDFKTYWKDKDTVRIVHLKNCTGQAKHKLLMYIQQNHREGSDKQETQRLTTCTNTIKSSSLSMHLTIKRLFLSFIFFLSLSNVTCDYIRSV